MHKQARAVRRIAQRFPSLLQSLWKRECLVGILILVLGFLWFWFWRSNQWTGGDSEQWEREIDFGRWFRKRQMCSFAMMQLVHTIGRGLWGWSARLAINCTSCMAGAVSILVLWRMYYRRSDALWPILIVATGGFTALFYGHIETYAQPVAALLFHLLAIQRTIENRWRPWTVVATFGLGMAFHLVFLFALPAAVLIALWETQRRGSGCRGYLSLVYAALPAVLLWYAITRMDLGHGELVGPCLIHPPSELIRRPWLVFTHATVPLKFKFMLWNGGLASCLAVWVFLHSRWQYRKDRMMLYLLAYFICFLVFAAVWTPGAGDRDFDLFCFPWVIAYVAVSRRIMDLPARELWFGLVLGINVILWLMRPVVFSDIGHRGHGTIVLESTLPSTEHNLILLDERLRLHPINKYIPRGPHEVTLRRARKEAMRRIVFIEPGDTYYLRLDETGLHCTKGNDETARKQTR